MITTHSLHEKLHNIFTGKKEHTIQKNFDNQVNVKNNPKGVEKNACL